MTIDNGVSFLNNDTPNNGACNILSGRVLFFNEINGTGYIEQEFGSEKLRFTYKHILKEGYRSVYEGQAVEYGVSKVGTGTKITFLRVIESDL